MSLKPQHEIHPDAEVLSAFAEQALSAKERDDVLKHLAVCGRCREIVALACEAAGSEVKAAHERVVRPRAWWKSWGLALAPAAAVAATAVIAIYVHERSLEKSAEVVANLERQRVNEPAPILPQASPKPPEQAAPPAPPNTPAKPRKTERTDAAKRAPLDEPDETVAAPPPEVTNGLLSRREEPAETSEFERHRSNDEALARTGVAPSEGATPAGPAAYDEERKKHAEEKAEDRRHFAATTPMPGSDHDTGSGAAGSTEPGDAPAQKPETQPARAGGYLQLHGMRSMVDLTAHSHPFHLPSGQPAVSTASAGRRILAIDRRGEAFLSEDSGETWEKIKRQWTGRAVVARSHPEDTRAPYAAPAPETEGAIAGSGNVFQPDTVFDLVNDQSQVWISPDGRIWTPK